MHNQLEFCSVDHNHLPTPSGVTAPRPVTTTRRIAFPGITLSWAMTYGSAKVRDGLHKNTKSRAWLSAKSGHWKNHHPWNNEHPAIDKLGPRPLFTLICPFSSSFFFFWRLNWTGARGSAFVDRATFA